MKKIAIACALLSSFVASSVWADAASDLKSRLDKVSSFRSEEHTSELQSHWLISYAVFCLKKKFF